MGGYWGVSASYAMETCPNRFRGVLSGLIQAGYPIGYLLAPVVMHTVVPAFGWRAAFFSGIPFAILVITLMSFAPESTAWKQHRPDSVRLMFRSVLEYKRAFFYLLLMMTALLCLSHGAQDLYPDFLKGMPTIQSDKILGMNPLLVIPITYNIGAIAGALLFGQISQISGRRKAIMIALVLALLSIPTWAFGTSVTVLLASSFLMQAGVQGAFGVIPAHLNELSPDCVRSAFAGTVYQLGSLLASPSTTMEFMLRDRFGYPTALAVFEAVSVVLMFIIIWAGPEADNRSFLSGEQS